MQFHFLITLILTCFGCVLSAQESPLLRNFTPEAYEGMNQNWAITQDDRGNIYLANTGGILVFDGARWKTLRLPGNPAVRSVTYAHGKLYAGGYGQFGYFEHLDRGQSTYVSLSDQLSPQERTTEEIWQISVVDSNKVFFQSFGRLFLTDSQQTKPIPTPGVMMFGSFASSSFVLPVNDQGIFQWGDDERFSLIPGTEKLASRLVAGIVHRPSELLIATQQSGIFRLATGKLTPWNPSANQEIPNWRINRFIQLKNGTLVVGTIQRGVFLLSPRGDILHRFHRGNGLQNNTILSLFEDRSGNLWIGMDRGVDLLVRSEPIRYFTGEHQALGAVYAAAYTDQNFYLGTNQGLFLRPLDRPDALFRLVNGTEGQVWELRQFQNELLCGHNDGTFAVVDDQARKISSFSGGWQTTPMAKDTNSLLQATYTGLVRLQKEQQNWSVSQLPGFTAPIRYLVQTDSLTLLAVHNARGAYRIELNKDLEGYQKIDTLSDTKLSQAAVSNWNNEWVLQSPDRLFSLKDSLLLPIDNLLDRPVNKQVTYLRGRSSTDDWFAVKADRVDWYQADSLKRVLPIRMPAQQPVIVPWRNGNYLFCLDDGYALLASASGQTDFPPVTVKTAYFADDRWESELPDLATQPLTLPYRHNRLRFRFSQPIFDRPLKFSFRLPGISNNWSEWSSQSEREFTNLSEGGYQLEVKGNWSEQITTFSFVISPPWYRSWWAYLIYLFLLIAFLFGLSAWHRLRLDRQQRLLEIKRKRELQRQKIMERYDRIREDSHRKSKELANTTLSLAQKKEMLLTLKEELANTRKKHGTSMPGKAYQKLVHLIDHHLGNEEDWTIFEAYFEQVHEAFLKRLRKQHPGLTSGDLKLAAYLRMNLSSKEIAPLLHISVRGVENKRYRLRKKLGLAGEDNINAYLLKF